MSTNNLLKTKSFWAATAAIGALVIAFVVLGPPPAQADELKPTMPAIASTNPSLPKHQPTPPEQAKVDEVDSKKDCDVVTTSTDPGMFEKAKAWAKEEACNLRLFLKKDDGDNATDE